MQKRHLEGPLVEVIYRKEGVDAMSPGYFAMGFVHMALSALLAGALLSLAAPALRSYVAGSASPPSWGSLLRSRSTCRIFSGSITPGSSR